MASIQVKIEQAAVEVQQARAKFKQAEVKYNALLKQFAHEAAEAAIGSSHTTVGVEEAGAEDNSNGHSHNLADEIVAIVSSDPSKRWRLPDIFKLLHGAKLGTVRQAVYRLVEGKKIKKAGYGKFRAVKMES